MEKKEMDRFREIVIPGDVLYDLSLSDGAKIIYGKIAKLSDLKGHCWSSNSFLDGTKSGRNASRAIAELKNAGYIFIDNVNSKSRKIRLSRIMSKINPAKSGEVVNNRKTNPAKSGEVVNNSKINPAKNGEVVNSRKTNPAKSGEVVNNRKINPAKNGEVDIKISPNPAKNGEVDTKMNSNLAKFGDRTTSSSSFNKATTTSDLPENKNDSLPTVEKVVAEKFSTHELKAAFSKIDKNLIFSVDFYNNAAVFMAEKCLDLNYLSWLFKKCENKNPTSFNGLYFKLFTMDNIAEEYKTSLEKTFSEPALVSCPACGEYYAHGKSKCPVCGLQYGADHNEIILFRELCKLTPEKRDKFSEMEKDIINSNFDFFQKSSMLENLYSEFGLSGL